MRRSLSELICDDLEELAYFGSDVVASEEASRFLLALYRSKNALGKVDLVHKVHFLSALETIIQANELYINNKNNLALYDKANRFKQYQFLIEVGSRSQAEQRRPDTIHYCAVDLFIIPDERPIAFVADHYRGNDGYYYDFQQAAEKLNIFFVIAGEGIYQADSVHCPIFSIYHLLLTYRDSDFISDFLLNILNNNRQSSHSLINWNQLPPDYLILSQSVSRLWQYVDFTKANEQTDATLPSTVLSQAFFDKKVSVGLYPDLAEERKIRNRNIKLIASQMAGKAVKTLEANKKGIYNESMLINVCYGVRYPLVYKLLMNALIISHQYPVTVNKNLHNYTESHPLFELAFYYAGVVENCLKNKNFESILTNRATLIALQLGWINPFRLFNRLTQTSKECKVQNENCNIVFNNLDGFSHIVERLLSDNANPKDDLLDLLLSRKLKAFFKEESLCDLFRKGLISIRGIKYIQPYQINKGYYNQLKEDFDKLAYLKTLFVAQEEPTSHVFDKSQEHRDLFIFDVPEPTTSVSPREIQLEKPRLNIALLAKSMSNTVFVNTQASSTQERNNNSKSELITIRQ